MKDGSGFLSISDRPSITNWAFETRNISKEYSTPFVINGMHMNIPTPMGIFDFASRRDEVTAAYSGNVVQRWNLKAGDMKIVKNAAPAEEAIERVAGLQDGVAVISRASGQIEVYADAEGAAHPAGTLKFEPLTYLGEIGATQAFLVTKSGAAGRLDVSTPSQPKIDMLPALGVCAGKVAVPGFAVCLSAEGNTRILRNADDTLVADWQAPAEGMGAAFIADDGTRMAIGDKVGHITVRAVPDGNELEKVTLALARPRSMSPPPRAASLLRRTMFTSPPRCPTARSSCSTLRRAPCAIFRRTGAVQSWSSCSFRRMGGCWPPWRQVTSRC